MPYSCSENKSSCIKCVLFTILFFISFNIIAQVKWDGEAGDDQWTSAANWSGNSLPGATDDVVLDNSLVAGDYNVMLPGSAAAIIIKAIAVSPAAANSIQLVLPVSSTATPAFTATGPGYGITIDSGGLFVNSSGSASTASIAVNDSFRINNGGQYTHNTRSAHAAIVTILSKLPGTESGVFKFDVPGGGYTFASTGRTYGALMLSADASGGSQSYATSAANPLIISSHFTIKAGVTVNFDLTAPVIIKGNYVQEGGVCNLASQPNNNVFYVQSNFMQTGGIITETSTGLPAIELNGTVNQHIQAAGSITGDVNFRINNSGGVRLLSNLSLPYNLHLVNGIVNANTFLLTLLPGCSIQADSINSNCFIDGPCRKEGLSAATHFLFPVGKGITQRWLALKDVTGNYTVEFFKFDPRTLSSLIGAGIHHISSIEYWRIEADITPPPTARVELSFDNVNSGGVTDMATLRVAQFASGMWMDRGNTATTGSAGSSGSVISNPLNTFNGTALYFSLASSDAFQNPLPLKLLSFNSDMYSDRIVLNWQIESSRKPAYFELQSSAGGNHFITMSKIDAVLNQAFYQYTDKREFTGKQYYRLKLTGEDGSFFYSNPVMVISGNSSTEFLQVRPSFVKSGASLFINAGAGRKAQINIYNMEGKLIQRIHVFLHHGNNTIPLQLKSFSPGIYLLSVTGADNRIQNTRFIMSE